MRIIYDTPIGDIGGCAEFSPNERICDVTHKRVINQK